MLLRLAACTAGDGRPSAHGAKQPQLRFHFEAQPFGALRAGDLGGWCPRGARAAGLGVSVHHRVSPPFEVSSVAAVPRWERKTAGPAKMSSLRCWTVCGAERVVVRAMAGILSEA